MAVGRVYAGRIPGGERGSFGNFVDRYVVTPVREGLTGLYRRRITPLVDAYRDAREKKILFKDMQAIIPEFADRAIQAGGAFTNPESAIVNKSQITHRNHSGVTIKIKDMLTISVQPYKASVTMRDEKTDGNYQLIYVPGRRIPGVRVRQLGTFWYRNNDGMIQIPSPYEPDLQNIFFRDIARIIDSRGLDSLPVTPSIQADGTASRTTQHHPIVADNQGVHTPSPLLGMMVNHGNYLPVPPQFAEQILSIPAREDLHLPELGLRPMPKPRLTPHLIEHRTPPVSRELPDWLPINKQGGTDRPYDQGPSPYTNMQPSTPWSLAASSLVDNGSVDALKGLGYFDPKET